MENENKDDLMFTPAENENKRSPIMRYAIIGVMEFPYWDGLYFGNQYIADEKAKAMKWHKRNQKQRSKATFRVRYRRITLEIPR